MISFTVNIIFLLFTLRLGKSSDFRHSTTTSSQDWQTLGSTDGNTVGSRSRDYSKPWLSGSRSSSQKVNLSNDNKFRKGYSEEDQQNFENQQSMITPFIS